MTATTPSRFRKKRSRYISAQPVPGYVYLLRSEHGYKVGKAKNLKNRLSTFGLTLPFEVELVHALRTQDMARCEWHFHGHFKSRRINGEWFRLSKEDLIFFCEAGTPNGIGSLFYVEPTPNLTPYKLGESHERRT